MAAAWRATDDVHQTALLTALTQLGVEYRSATSEPGVGFDCSGLMLYAWGEAGFTLTRQSGSQISEADARDEDTAKAGDLAQYPGHVMMYLGVPQDVRALLEPGERRRAVDDVGGPRRRPPLRRSRPTYGPQRRFAVPSHRCGRDVDQTGD